MIWKAMTIFQNRKLLNLLRSRVWHNSPPRWILRMVKSARKVLASAVKALRVIKFAGYLKGVRIVASCHKEAATMLGALNVEEEGEVHLAEGEDDKMVHRREVGAVVIEIGGVEEGEVPLSLLEVEEAPSITEAAAVEGKASNRIAIEIDPRREATWTDRTSLSAIHYLQDLISNILMPSRTMDLHFLLPARLNRPEAQHLLSHRAQFPTYHSVHRFRQHRIALIVTMPQLAGRSFSRTAIATVKDQTLARKHTILLVPLPAISTATCVQRMAL